MTVQPASCAAPHAVPEPDWVACSPFPSEGSSAFVSVGAAGTRLRVAYFKRPRDGRLVGRAWFGPETEGPPGHAHGGSIAAVLDEALGAAAWASGHGVVVASLTVEFRQMVPLGVDATFEAWIDHVDRRKVHTRARLMAPSGDLFAEGKALCVVIGDEHVARFRSHRHARARSGG